MPNEQQQPAEIRESCLDCVRKHLIQAGILMLEYRKSDPEEYPLHPWWANGHLAEAEDELSGVDAEFSKTIRIYRLKYLQDHSYQIPIEGLVLAINEIATRTDKRMGSEEETPGGD